MRNLGKVVMTNGIRKALADFPSMHFVIQDILEKFKANDWGILCKEDAEVNFMALEQQEQVHGTGTTGTGTRSISFASRRDMADDRLLSKRFLYKTLWRTRISG